MTTRRKTPSDPKSEKKAGNSRQKKMNKKLREARKALFAEEYFGK